jgi:hypothetical protein
VHDLKFKNSALQLLMLFTNVAGNNNFMKSAAPLRLRATSDIWYWGDDRVIREVSLPPQAGCAVAFNWDHLLR